MVYPPNLPLSAASVAVFEDGLSPEYDITWSFTYQLTNYTAGDEFGFCLFLQDESKPLSGGGVGLDLGYSGGTQYVPTSAQGMNGGIVGIGIDSLGVFASDVEYIDTSTRDGQAELQSNSVTLRGSSSLSGVGYPLLDTKQISAFNVISDGPKTLRARLGDYGRKIQVDYKGEGDTFYTNLLTTNIEQIPFDSTTRFRPGITIVKPLTGANTNGEAIITNFHVEGNTEATTTTTFATTAMVPFEPDFNSLGPTPEAPPEDESPQRLPFLGIEPAIGCPDIYCGLSATGSNYANGFYPNTVLYSLSAFVGDVDIQWSSTNNPYRFIYEYDGEVAHDTGYVGSEIFNYGGFSRSVFISKLDASGPVGDYPALELAPDGYPIVNSSLSAGETYFYKDTDKSRLTLNVFAPLSTTDWEAFVGCPYYTLSCGNEDSYLCGLTRQHEALRKIVFPNY